MSSTDPVNLIPWILLGVLCLVLFALLIVGARLIAGYANVVLGGIRANLTADMDGARARTAAEAKMLADLVGVFTESLATLAKATSFYVAGDMGGQGGNVDKPMPRDSIDRGNIDNIRGAEDEYIDWTTELPGLEPEEGARSRFIPPGTNPLDVIRAAKGGE